MTVTSLRAVCVGSARKGIHVCSARRARLHRAASLHRNAASARLTSIIGLFLRCGPMAIIRGVWTIVVSSIDRMKQAWAWPYVSGEPFEIVHPFVADRDAAPPVSIEGGIVSVQASTLHVRPDVVKRVIWMAGDAGAMDATRFSKRNSSGSFAAATALRHSFPEIRFEDYRLATAVAAALPRVELMWTAPAGPSDDRKQSESGSGQIVLRRVHRFALSHGQFYSESHGLHGVMAC